MAKKVRRKRVPKVKALSGEEYWKLRFHAELMERLRLKKLLAEKESAILRLRSVICEEKLSSYEDEISEAEAEYNLVRQEVEVAHKIKLENCNIDNVNYTIHGGIENGRS